MDAYTIIPQKVSEPYVFPAKADWEQQIGTFFEEVLFPKMILFKRANDILIASRCAQPLGDSDDDESIFDERVGDVIFSGDLSDDDEIKNLNDG